MRVKTLLEREPATHVIVFDKGEEFYAGLVEFARTRHLTSGRIDGIGALETITLGYYNRIKKDYKHIPIHEQVEVLSLMGDFALKDGKPTVHAHIVVAKEDGTAHGGHVLEGRVWPTLEVIVTETPAHLKKKLDPETGLALIDPSL